MKKLNNRQLKKASTNAFELLTYYYKLDCDRNDIFQDLDGDWWLCIRSHHGEYEEVLILNELHKCFDNEWDFRFGIESRLFCKEMESMSFSNQINYMIKFVRDRI